MNFVTVAPLTQSTAPTAFARPVSAAPRERRRKDLLLLIFVLGFVSVFLINGIHRAQELGLSEDESRHAMTGQYFADLLKDRPVHEPVAYTYRYYAQYPALGLIHWPPFFHFTEGLMFLVLGRSAEVARATVALFTLVGLAFWFLLMRRFHDACVAALSTALLALVPSVALFQRAVMLEVPTLAMCIATTYLWVRFLDSGRYLFLYLATIAAALTLLTKEHSVYLLPFAILTLFTERRWKRLWSWKALGAILLGAAIAGPYFVFALRQHGGTVEQHIVQQRSYSIRDLTFYFETLPGMLGWPALILSLLGVLTFWKWDRKRNTRLMLLWIAASYITFTFLASRESRYGLYWLPAFAYFASWPAVVRQPSRWSRALAISAFAVLLTAYGWDSWKGATYPYLNGYSAAAKYLVDRTQGVQLLLVDDDRPGNLSFYLRAEDPERRFVIVRKGLYVTRLISYFGAKQLADSPEDIQRILSEYGIRYILVSDTPPFEFPIQQTLRNLLRTPRFRLVQRFPIDFGRDYISRTHLLLYEDTQASTATASDLRIPMMTLDKDIVVPMAAFRKR